MLMDLKIAGMVFNSDEMKTYMEQIGMAMNLVENDIKALYINFTCLTGLKHFLSP